MTQAPKERPGITLRIFLSGLIGMSLLPLLLLGVWLAWDSQRTALMEQERSAWRLAGNFMTTVDEYLDARMRALGLLAATPMLDDPARWPEFYALAQSFQRFFDGHVILAEADEPRRMLLNTRAPLDAQLPVLPRAERQSTASMAIAHGRPAVGDIVFGPVAEEPWNCIAAPVLRNGGVVFVLLSTFATSLLQEQADQFELPSDWAMYLRDGSGNVIAQRLPPESDVGRDESPEKRFVVQSTVGPWFVEIEIPDRVWLSLRAQSAISLLLGLLPTTLVGVLGARLAGKRLQRAVASLVGPPTTKPAARIVEIEEVRRLLASTQEEMVHSALYFKRLFENAPAALALSNQEGGILSRNTRFDELTGYSANETPTWAEWWSRVCPGPELHVRIMTDWKSTIATPDATPVEHRIRRKDGAERIVQLFSAGFNSGILCSFLDVTELRRAEVELRARQAAKLEHHAEMRLALLNQMQDANAARKRAERALEELRHSNALLNNAEQLAHIGSWTLDVATDILTWSEGAYRIFGYDPREITATHKTFLDSVHPDDRSLVNEAYSASLRDGSERYEIEHRIIRNDTGDVRHVHELCEHMRDASGIVIRSIGMSQDITERVQAEQTLKEEREQLREAQAIAHVGSWDYDALRNKLVWSDETHRIFGTIRGSFEENYEAFLETVHPADRPEIVELYARSLEDVEVTYEIEHRMIRRDNGEERRVLEKCRHHRDGEGKVLRSTGVVHDITDIRKKEAELKAAAEALQDTNQRLAAFLQISHALTSSLDMSQAMQMLVDNAAKVMRLESSAVYLLEGETIRLAATTPALPDDFPEKFRCAALIDHPHIQKALTSGSPVVIPDTAKVALTQSEQEIVRSRNLHSNLYLPILHRDQPNGVLLLSDTTKPRSFHEEEIALLQGFADQAAQVIDNIRLYEEAQNHAVKLEREIGQRKKAEEALRRLNLELEERVRRRTKNLEEANMQLEAFSYSVSHDLRAPLRGVTGLTRILLDKHATELSQEGRKLCAMITDNATAMGLLIDDLLLFSRAGRKALHVSPIDMTALVRAVIEELSSTEEAARVDFQIQDLPSAVADPGLLHQVWQNLLANAVKFSTKKERPVVQVRAERKNGQTVYHVQDNGAGFDMRHVHKIFGVFTRLHSSREFEGTGVGLAIVQQVITRHGGQVWAQGEPDKGAKFSFTLNVVGTELMKSTQQ